LIALLVNGKIGAHALKNVVAANKLVPEPFRPLLLMEVKNALQPVMSKTATHNLVLWIASWAIGVILATALPLVEVVPRLALAPSRPLQLMEAKNVVRLLSLRLATPSIAQLIASWVNGNLGARAPRHVEVAVHIVRALL
jgi:hypothetical protein